MKLMVTRSKCTKVKKNADNTKHVLIFGDKNPYSFVEE